MLRSAKDLRGYAIHATDGVIGEVEDMYCDNERWTIRYFVVDTGSRLSGRKVLVPPLWIDAVDWSTSKVSVDLFRHAIQGAPHFDAAAQFTREREQAMYEHYGRSGYWVPSADHDKAVPAVK
jgi:hypothetical protein